jgi:CubicO group peptidase (beta-lactamase class C family)
MFESSFLYFPNCVTVFKRFCRAGTVSYSQDFFWRHDPLTTIGDTHFRCDQLHHGEGRIRQEVKKLKEGETLKMKRRYSILISGLLIVIELLYTVFDYTPGTALAAGPAAPALAGPTDPVELGDFFNNVMASAMKTNPFPGAVIAVVKDGQLFFQKGYGYADLEKQTPVDPSATIFRIGSMTKLFTWTAVMQLAEQGKLDLEKDVNTYLDFKIPVTFSEPITLKNLLSHTPGFEERNDGHRATRLEELTPLDQYLKTHVPSRVFLPGQIAAYSNYGCALAGYIVERVSGMPFAEYVEKNIFTPLAMTRSSLRQPLPADLTSDLSNGYRYAQGEDEYVKAEFEYVVDYPAGSASSTAIDMANFMLAHLQNGQLGDARILSEQTARQMHSQLFTPDPRIPGMAYGFFESSINGHRILSHGGDTLFFHSNLWLIPDQNIGIFIATNGTGGATIATMLIYQYMDHYYPIAQSPAPARSADFTSRVKPYLGTYYSTRRNFTTFESLMVGLPPYNLRLDANNNLVLGVAGASIQLVEVEPDLLTDPNNANVQLVLHTDKAGQAYILWSDPWAYMKIPWYGTTGFRDLMLQRVMLLFLCSLIGWGSVALVGSLHRLRKQDKGDLSEPQPKTRSFLPTLARWVAALFGLVLIVLFVGMDSLLSARDPLFGYPVILLAKPPTFYILMMLPYILAGLTLLMLVFALLAWTRRYWGWASRLHYSLLALLGLAVVWAIWYWNLLF